MTLTKSLDKRGGFTSVFIWQLRRTLPAAVIYWLLMAGITLWDSIVRRGVDDHVHLMEIFITGFAFYMPIMCLGDCFSRRQADYINALPVPRGELYLASVLNGLWFRRLPHQKPDYGSHSLSGLLLYDGGALGDVSWLYYGIGGTPYLLAGHSFLQHGLGRPHHT